MIYTCATVTGCILVLLSSHVIDKFGLRKSTLGALLLWALVFFMLGNGENFYGLFSNILSRQLYFALFIYLNFSLLRFLGQNMLPMLGRIQLVKTFSKNQGVVIAISGMFAAIVAGSSPHIMYFLSRDGWQNAYKLLAVLGFIVLAIFFFLLRDRRIGKQIPAQPIEIKETLEKISRRKLLKMPIFWCIIFPLCINSLIGSSLMIHIIDIFRENGIDSKVARDSCFYLCCISVFAGPIFGKQVDQNRIKRCALLMLCLQFLGLLGLTASKSIWGCVVYVVCIGSSWGGYGVLKTATWAKIFGNRDISLILGLIYFVSAIVGAIGVSLMSFSSTHFGSYFHLINAIEIIILGAIIFVFRKFPRKV
jgi:predicted MFS family arabinose efflux permease